ncbi:expressed unknown protein [Seminavis robusta]|uniref:Uncharacterized protein n=1 Tax=Seminavis robusta TaxID=568900 RepID=A0A9N8EST0_9STRA|nr:expressed unknown protein [Seminavis robusta]|eukprot:Sro2001_g310340.1 n/a (587) ;mRNA; f:15247-17007
MKHSKKKRETGFGRGLLSVMLLIALLVVSTPRLPFLSSKPLEGHRLQQQGRRRTAANNNGTEDEWQAEKWHPEKSDVDCESYWEEHGSDSSLLLLQDVDLPCRGQIPVQGDNNNNAEMLNIPPNVVTINISLALDHLHFSNGIPRRLTSAVQEYLNATNVTLTFLQEEYHDGRHFVIQLYQPPSQWINRNLMEQQQDNRDATSVFQGEDDDSIEELTLTAISSLKGYLVDYAPNTKFAWYYHIVYLTVQEQLNATNQQSTNTLLTPVEDERLMEWLQAELEGIVHDDIWLQGPLVGPYYDTNNFDPQDNNEWRQISFLEWTLQEDGIPIGGVAIPGEEDFDLQYTYYSDNALFDAMDVYQDAEDGTAYVFDMPVGGGLPESGSPPPPEPGEMAESSVYIDGESEETEPATAMPIEIHDREKDTTKDDRIYVQPLSTSFTPRQWWGLAGLLSTLVLTATLALVAGVLAKQRDQDELWGNPQEDIDYLNVGWRFGRADPAIVNNNQGDDGDDKDSNGKHQGIPENYMMMEVFDKRGLGYREGSSLLMGGYEYKSKTILHNGPADVSAVPQPPRHNRSYKTDPSVTPFG